MGKCISQMKLLMLLQLKIFYLHTTFHLDPKYWLPYVEKSRSRFQYF